MFTPARGLVPHSEEETGISYQVGAPVQFDWSNPIHKNNPPPGKNQNSSGSCPAQAFGYGFYLGTTLDISREDIYSHVFLPGGGAYLVSPGQYVAENGFLLLSKFPDPNPETEANMEAFVVNVQDGDRIRTFQVSQSQPVQNPTIDQVAQAIVDNAAAIIGIRYSPEGFNTSWTYPTYYSSYPGQEGHALCCLNPIIHNGLNAIDCMSSWYDAEGPDGLSTHHVIDQTFFDNGGVFELVTFNVTELTNHKMQLVQTPDQTVYIQSGVNDVKILGIADATTLALFGDEPITQIETLPTPESFTIGQGFVVNPK